MIPPHLPFSFPSIRTWHDSYIMPVFWLQPSESCWSKLSRSRLVLKILFFFYLSYKIPTITPNDGLKHRWSIFWAIRLVRIGAINKGDDVLLISQSRYMLDAYSAACSTVRFIYTYRPMLTHVRYMWIWTCYKFRAYVASKTVYPLRYTHQLGCTRNSLA